MRNAKLHKVLLLHILWYVRQQITNSNLIKNRDTSVRALRTSSHVVLSKRDKALNMLRDYVNTRKASVPFKIKRASSQLRKLEKMEIDISDDNLSSIEDMCCVTVIRCLQTWLDHDFVAYKEIKDIFVMNELEKNLILKLKFVSSDTDVSMFPEMNATPKQTGSMVPLIDICQ